MMHLFFDKIKDRPKAAAQAFLCAAALLLIILLPKHTYLSLTDSQTGAAYAHYLVEEGTTFSVGFIHSVNQTPVIDCYAFDFATGEISVTDTYYYGFGAGVQSQLNPGETLTYTDDGAMVVGNINKAIPQLVYCVGMVSDHVLTVSNQPNVEISLRDLCGRGSLVLFSITTRYFPPTVSL